LRLAFSVDQTISAGKGNLVRNTDHKREKSTNITQLITDISCMFSNPELATSYMEGIRAEKPRYVGDQLILLKHTIEGYQYANPRPYFTILCPDEGV
jgi:hypothetical protein